MFVPSGASPIAVTSAPSCSNAPRREAGVRAVRAVDRDAEAGAGRVPNALEDVLEVAVGRDVDTVDLAAAARRARRAAPRSPPRRRRRACRPSRSKNLTPLYSGRVVRGGDDDAEVEPLLAHQHATPGVGSTPARSAMPAGGGDPGAKRVLEHRPGAARVAPDDDADARARPLAREAHGRTAEAERELRRQRCRVRDAADAVGAEQPAHAEGAGALALGELRAPAGALEAGLLALDLARVAREEALALELGAQLRIGLDRARGRCRGAGRRPGPSRRRRGSAPGRRSGRRGSSARAATAPIVRCVSRPKYSSSGLPLTMNAPVPGVSDHAGDGRLALAGAAVGGGLRHVCGSSSSLPGCRSGFGFCAACGCSGPA